MERSPCATPRQSSLRRSGTRPRGEHTRIAAQLSERWALRETGVDVQCSSCALNECMDGDMIRWNRLILTLHTPSLGRAGAEHFATLRARLAVRARLGRVRVGIAVDGGCRSRRRRRSWRRRRSGARCATAAAGGVGERALAGAANRELLLRSTSRAAAQRRQRRARAGGSEGGAHALCSLAVLSALLSTHPAAAARGVRDVVELALWAALVVKGERHARGIRLAEGRTPRVARRAEAGVAALGDAAPRRVGPYLLVVVRQGARGDAARLALRRAAAPASETGAHAPAAAAHRVHLRARPDGTHGRARGGRRRRRGGEQRRGAAQQSGGREPQAAEGG
jgi:hypothetical protein